MLLAPALGKLVTFTKSSKIDKTSGPGLEQRIFFKIKLFKQPSHSFGIRPKGTHKINPSPTGETAA
jgi:hypothetical protein